MRPEGAGAYPLCQIPDFDAVVIASTGKNLPIGGDSDRLNIARMSSKDGNRLGGWFRLRDRTKI